MKNFATQKLVVAHQIYEGIGGDEEYCKIIGKKLDGKKILSFLNHWGCRIDYDYEKEIEEGRKMLIQKSEFKYFNGKNLIASDLNKDKDKIKFLFKFKIKGIGGTSKSKLLHILLSDYFVMWDKKIANDYNLKQNAEGYFKFLVLMKEEFKSVDRKCLKSILKNNHTVAKLIDEYNWIKKTKNINVEEIIYLSK